MVPKLKKKITSFLTKEEGKISRENLIKAGVLITTFSIAAAMNAKPTSSAVTCNPDCPAVPNPADKGGHNDSACGVGHDNNLNLQYINPTATGTHNHCAQTCHCSHGSHSDGGPCSW